MSDDIFGRVRMGYVVVQSRRLPEWQHFAVQGLGLQEASTDANELAFRIDAHARRLIVCDGDAEDVLAVGWQLDDEASLSTVLARCRSLGLTVTEGDAERARQRGVPRFWRIDGPKGLAVECFIEAHEHATPFAGLCSGFVTGEGGMGHLALTTRQPASMVGFWQHLFDARLSDCIEARIRGVTLDIRFLRLNSRHHSVAIAATRGLAVDPIRTRVQHLNLQVATLEDMSEAYARCRALDYRMAMGVGQHSNDRELSFYVITPSSFEVEVGWNPIVVQEDTWKTALHRGISTWGHKPQDQTRADQLREVWHAMKSLSRSERAIDTGGHRSP